jgi:hypothetical protein
VFFLFVIDGLWCLLCMPTHSSNSLAGVLLVLSRPFHTGDYIQVASFEGLVTGIDNRYVRLRKSDGSTVLVPAYTVLASPIVIRGNTASPASYEKQAAPDLRSQ